MTDKITSQVEELMEFIYSTPGANLQEFESTTSAPAPAVVADADAASAAVTTHASPPDEHSSMPPASDGGVEHGGDGGCTAVALTKIGVWPSAAEAAADLDKQIPTLHQKFQRERGTCEESEAGIRGEQWHEEAIKNAIVSRGWHIRSIVIHPTKSDAVSLRSELKNNLYLVFGVTNNRWYKKGNPRPQPLKYPDYPANAPSISTEGWHHTVAIVDGKMHDHDVSEPLSSLWLRDDNQPDRDKGFLRSIRKVWRIYRCSRPGSGCRGKCALKRPRDEEQEEQLMTDIEAPLAQTKRLS